MINIDEATAIANRESFCIGPGYVVTIVPNVDEVVLEVRNREGGVWTTQRFTVPIAEHTVASFASACRKAWTEAVERLRGAA